VRPCHQFATSALCCLTTSANDGARIRSYRYTFLSHPDDDRALAAFVLMAESDETASRVAKELLEKSDAICVEVWSNGQLISRVNKPAMVLLFQRTG
jgi:hypothetical protein